ncbi:tudor and KH domain-containing protein homolog isoform X2 [Harmonia axyridis]|uniref:tudor and KH domain-containing protein homolog isoform X2 n=1 Tax=Harmonia axyridis TaxID=115357 RepID=UPI001E276774|nr:tudor and KH domain-containing protein homolog isoform X2 [Harmonia axyridis]
MTKFNMQTYKSLATVLGLSLCGISLYIIRKYWPKDEEDTLMKTANFTTVEFQIPRQVINNVIGKNGSNIKQVEFTSGTRISFRQSGGEKICVIRGTVEACYFAKSIIKEFIGAKITISQDSGDNSVSKVILQGTLQEICSAKGLIQEKIQQLMDLQKVLDMTLAKREPRAPPKSASNKSTGTSEYGTGRRESLSDVVDTPFQVYVSALVDPSKFWVQIVGPKATELDRLVEDMTEFYNDYENKSLHFLNTIKKGNLVAAIFKYDKKWYRAEVVSVNNVKKEAELHYVDYGDTDFVSFGNIMELRTDFLRLHFQAIECYLDGVEPVGDKWSEEAVDNFEEWTHVAQWEKLGAKIKNYSNGKRQLEDREGSPVPGIELFESVDGRDISIGQKLLDNNYAKRRTHPPSRSTYKESNVSENPC